MRIVTPFLLKPDWNDGIRAFRRWRTVVRKTKSNLEMRSGLRRTVVRALEFSISLMSAAESAYLERKLAKYMHEVLGVPNWVDGTELTAQATAGTATLIVDEHDYREFEEGGFCVLVDSDDPEVYEIGRIDELLDTPARITLTSNLSSTWASGTEVFPLLPMRIDPVQSFSKETDSYGGFNFSGEEELGTQVSLTTTSTTTTTSSTVTTISTTTSTTA